MKFLAEGFLDADAGNTGFMDWDPSGESVDDTLQTSVLRVRTSRELLAEIDQRLERGAELLEGRRPTIDLRDGPADTE